MKLLWVTIFSGLMLFNMQAVQAGEHAHFAAFFDNGSNKSFAFPTVINGDNVEQDMLKLGAEMMIFAHSAGIKNGDVWTLQNDTLREVGGEFQDFGLDCKLSMKLGPFKVAGLCSVFMTGAANSKTKTFIKPMLVEKEVVWYKLFEDKENHLAGYFMRETAADFNH
ncbi:MAG: hypothetical protein R8M46_00155 [Ghiorsea sp.]